MHRIFHGYDRAGTNHRGDGENIKYDGFYHFNCLTVRRVGRSIRGELRLVAVTDFE